MNEKEEVRKFLDQFFTKMKIFDIVYRDDRGKNKKALEELEIVPTTRRKIIESLTVDDFIEGPKEDTLLKLGDMWVFGKEFKQHDLYIKIMLGLENSSTICISFHIAEYPLHYAFK